MIIARLHRGGLIESMQTMREFETEEEMKQWFSDRSITCGVRLYDPEDIVIDYESKCDDPRTGWKDTMHVCTKRCLDEDFMQKYNSPQCIGMCATEYEAISREECLLKASNKLI